MTDSQSLPHVAPASERLRTFLTALAGGMALFLAAMPASEAARPLADRVTITRDTRGVPHIVADDEDAAAYGFGYAMAEDHAAEMGRKYLAARGESARVFGDEFADRDLAVRRLRNREAARDALRVIGREFRDWLTAYAAGVNAYVAAHRDRLPAWMPTVEPGDALALGRMGTITGALAPPAGLLRKYPATAVDHDGGRGSALDTADTDDDDGTTGSNAFAVAGSHTSVGVPLLLGNPHLRWAERYWEAHVRVPGRLDFYGSTLAGIPVLRAGFNADVAYVQTNNAPDNEDIYALALDPERPGHYRVGGRSYPIVRRQVTIEVTQPDGSVATRSQAVADTHLGPVVHEAAGRVFAVRALALEAWRHYEGFFHLWRVRSRAQFERVLDRQWMFMSNFTYADTAGHVLYRWNAMLPRRADETADYSLDVDASDPRRLWTGLHRPADLPRLLDPPGGYIQNAN
ncbi:MAG: penicillin acylase family protein, partial [Acidobacteria bacterium]|nr:penicillin acylase family protein [Acidobacteriota bacterium]